MAKTIYITHNPLNEQEEAIALRISHTARYHGLDTTVADTRSKLSDEGNKRKIKEAKLVLAFITEEVSPSLQKELVMAQSLDKYIIAIKDRNVQLGLTADNQKVFIFDYDSSNINSFNFEKLVLFVKDKVKGYKQKEEMGIAALLLIGLGMFALYSAINDD